jgi:hypothetical protein
MKTPKCADILLERHLIHPQEQLHAASIAAFNDSQSRRGYSSTEMMHVPNQPSQDLQR